MSLIDEVFYDNKGDFKLHKKIFIISIFVTLFISFGFINLSTSNDSFGFAFLLLSFPLIYPLYQFIFLTHEDPKRRLLLLLKAIVIDFFLSIPVTIMVSLFTGIEVEHLVILVFAVQYIATQISVEFLANDFIFLLVILFTFLFFYWFRNYQAKLKDKNENIKEKLFNMQIAAITYVFIKIFFMLIYYVPLVTYSDTSFSLSDLSTIITSDALFLSLFLGLFFFFSSSSAIVIISKEDKSYSSIIFNLIFNATILLMTFTVGFFNGSLTSFAKMAIILFIIIQQILTKRSDDEDLKRYNKYHFIALIVLSYLYFIAS